MTTLFYFIYPIAELANMAISMALLDWQMQLMLSLLSTLILFLVSFKMKGDIFTTMCI